MTAKGINSRNGTPYQLYITCQIRKYTKTQTGSSLQTWPLNGHGGIWRPCSVTFPWHFLDVQLTFCPQTRTKHRKQYTLKRGVLCITAQSPNTPQDLTTPSLLSVLTPRGHCCCKIYSSLRYANEVKPLPNMIWVREWEPLSHGWDPVACAMKTVA